MKHRCLIDDHLVPNIFFQEQVEAECVDYVRHAWPWTHGEAEAEQHGIDWWKKNVKSARHEKMLLIHTEIMLIKVWAEREVNNGSPLIDSW